MVALTADRNTPESTGDKRVDALAAAASVYAGALLMRDASGYIVPGQTATGLVGVGRAEERVDNSGGAAGDLTVSWKPGVFRFANSTAADEITVADIGTVCFAVDDQTVAKTDGTGTRSRAGIVERVDAQGVWVRFDEALTAAA